MKTLLYICPFFFYNSEKGKKSEHSSKVGRFPYKMYLTVSLVIKSFTEFQEGLSIHIDTARDKVL